nr:RNA 2',3'-cyclic phosphodiesterase [Paenibacillus soyae]
MFVALPVRGAAADELSEWVHTQRPRLPFRKWVHAQDYHITLQFLGELEEARLGELRHALEGVRVNEMSLRLNGGGTFGPSVAPRVLWSDIAGDLAELQELHRGVVHATQPLGFIPEERRYTAHITLARSYGEGAAPFPRELLAEMPSGAGWTADRIVLMRTRMHESPMYEIIGEYGLQKP